MTKTLVAYYSHTGNNKFLAGEIAKRLHGELEEIKPVINLHLLLLSGIGFGNKRTTKNPADYDRVILVGPVWMGSFIYPLRKFIEEHQNKVEEWLFVTCCGSSYKLKEDKYGHEMVFKKIRKLFPDLNIRCTALPVTMILPDEKQDDHNAMLEARLSKANFNGLFLEKFNSFIEEIR
jgi:flavodoxin